MKNKIRVLLVYFLMLVVFALVGYLIYFVLNYEEGSTKSVKKDENNSTDNFTIDDKCTYDITMSKFNDFADGKGPLDLCEGYNKFKVSSVLLDNKNLNIELVYYNGKNSIDDEEGVFINMEKVIGKLSKDNLINLGVFDNVLYIKTFNATEVDVMAYNSDGVEIYRLSKALSVNPVTDNVFTTLQLKNANLSKTNLDSNSFIFSSGGFSFNSDSKQECVEGQLYKGSTYKVNYIDGTFSAPTFVNNVGC